MHVAAKRDAPDLLRRFDQDLALLRHEDISADVFLGCEVGTPPPAFRRRCVSFVERALARFWSPQQRLHLFGDMLLPPDLAREALSIAYTNTAALAGAFSPEGTLLRYAARYTLYAEIDERLERFILAHGLGPLLRVFWIHRMFEHYRALEFYHPMAEVDFATGRLHLPAFPDFCRQDLLWAVATGRVSVKRVDDRVCVVMTRRGRERWEAGRRFWDEAHALEERERLRQRLAWLRRGATYETILDRIAPDHQEVRARFYRTTGIWPGAVVLDVGAGHGPGITAPGGVADLVGPRGQVIALDPQEHPLRVLAENARRRGLRNVRTLVGVGERMPLASSSVDIVLSQGSLHFMHVEAFLAEAHRVLRPGGVLALTFPLPGYGSKAPYFREAMALAAALADSQAPWAQLLPDPERVRAAVTAAGFDITCVDQMEGRNDFTEPQDLALFLLETVRLLQRGLSNLPWAAQRERIQQIQGQLALLADRFPPAERFANWSGCTIVASKPAPTGLVQEPPSDAIAVSDRVWVLMHEDAVLADGRLLPVAPSAARVLRVLAQAEAPLPTETLLARAGGMSRQTLYNAVNALRRALPSPTRVLLKRRIGYVLTGTNGRRR